MNGPREIYVESIQWQIRIVPDTVLWMSIFRGQNMDIPVDSQHARRQSGISLTVISDESDEFLSADIEDRNVFAVGWLRVEIDFVRSRIERDRMMRW